MIPSRLLPMLFKKAKRPVFPAAPPITAPRVEAMGIFVPGAAAASMYVPGATAGAVYVPGAEAGQVAGA